MSECAKSHNALDATTEAQVVEQVLAMFNDTNSGKLISLVALCNVDVNTICTYDRGQEPSCESVRRRSIIDGLLHLAHPIHLLRIGALVKKVSELRQMFIIDTLITYSAAVKDDQLRDLANLGLRTVIREIQPGTDLSKAATVGKLVPKLVDQLSQKANPTPTPDMLLNAAELLHDLFARFESE